MRRTLALGVLCLVAALSMAVALARTRSRSPAARPARSPALQVAPVPPADPATPDPESLRDIFRFQETLSPVPEPLSDLAPRQPRPTVPQADGPRLVGLVRRSGRLFAAFAVGDAVELAAPGEAVGGVTILSVSEDAVRVRRPDGSEATLPY